MDRAKINTRESELYPPTYYCQCFLAIEKDWVKWQDRHICISHTSLQKKN